VVRHIIIGVGNIKGVGMVVRVGIIERVDILMRHLHRSETGWKMGDESCRLRETLGAKEKRGVCGALWTPHGRPIILPHSLVL